MSIFECVSIQGIRSFDPNRAQVLEFLNPVTIILGQNGTGKTTIIESLKFATTGDLPPGSKVGGSFVHDPKLAQESEVKAKIALEIKDVNGNKLTVSRAIKATQKDKNKQISMQTLDSSIKRVTVDGKEVSISSKCADINLEMTNSLGVSKAVLENVIFCHQEESNWPLMEGKQVKERFDNLFATAKYVKALDSIRKEKMSTEATVKQCKTELKYLKITRDEANKKMYEKGVLASEVAAFCASVADGNGKLSPIETSIANVQRQIDQFSKYESELSAKTDQRTANERRIKELNENISEPLNFSVEELQSMIDDSDNELGRLKSEIDIIGGQISGLKVENTRTIASNNSLRIDKGGLATKIEAQNARVARFNERLDRVAADSSIERNRASATFTMKSIKDHIDGDCECLRAKLKIADEEIKSRQKILDDKVATKTKLEHDIDMNKEALKQKKIDLLKTEKRIASIGEGANKIDFIEKQLSNSREELDGCREAFNSNDARERIRVCTEDIKKEEEKLNETDINLSKILSLDTKFNDLKSLRQQINDKTTEGKRLRSRHSENLNTIFDNDVPKIDMKKVLSQKLSNWRLESHQNQSRLLTAQSQLASLTVEERQLRSKIEEKKELVKKFDDTVFRICGNSEFNESLTKLKKRKADLEEEIATVQGNVSLYIKFQSLLTKNGSDCPLCHREFCNESESAALITEINEKINFAPNLEKKSQELSKVNSNFEILLKLQPQSEEINNLRLTLIEDFEKELREKRNEIGKAKSTIEEVSTCLESIKGLESIGNVIQGDVALMEKLATDIKEAENKLTVVESQLPMSYDVFQQTARDLQLNKSAIQRHISAQKQLIDGERKSYEKSMNEENVLSTRINTLEKDRLAIQAGQQEWASLCSKKEELKAEVTITESKIHSNNVTIGPIVADIAALRNDFNNYQEQRKKFEHSETEKINNKLSEVRELEQTLADIKKFENECAEESLKDLENRIKKNDEDIKYNTECISEMEAAIGRCNGKISNNKIKKREMTDTVSIRQCQSLIGGLHEEIDVLLGRLRGTNKVDLRSQLAAMERKRSSMKEEIDGIIFRKNQAENKMKYIEQELQERYLDAGQVYLKMLAKMKVNELVASDLEKYYKALDFAVMSHHKTKMTEINAILKELWRNTYSGRDIDYIEICSDEESGSTGLKRRVYNYRVVMVKSGTRLDLRGRCSAGQKVLASLLIRLALAEVFCLNCGILALDEPTTNLDRDNIENLAFALIKIVKTRSKQKNFQLILITHDEDFLQLLSRSDYVDEYYKIQCNADGHSQILRSRIDHR